MKTTMTEYIKHLMPPTQTILLQKASSERKNKASASHTNQSDVNKYIAAHKEILYRSEKKISTS